MTVNRIQYLKGWTTTLQTYFVPVIVYCLIYFLIVEPVHFVAGFLDYYLSGGIKAVKSAMTLPRSINDYMFYIITGSGLSTVFTPLFGIVQTRLLLVRSNIEPDPGERRIYAIKSGLSLGTVQILITSLYLIRMPTLAFTVLKNEGIGALLGCVVGAIVVGRILEKRQSTPLKMQND